MERKFMNIFALIMLCVLSIQDLKEHRIRGDFVLGGIVLLLGLAIFRKHENVEILLLKSIFGIMLMICSIVWKAGIGIGDGLVCIMTGISLDFCQNIQVIEISFAGVILYGMIRSVLGLQSMKEEIPFVPFITIAYSFISFIG